MSEQVEQTIDAMIAKLTTNLPTAIDAINATITDGYTIDYPTEISFGPRNETQYPSIAVTPDITEEAVDTAPRIHFDHSIFVTAWLIDGDEEALARKLVRFQRVVRETLLKDRRPGLTIGDGGYGFRFVRDEYGPFFADDSGSTYTNWCRTVFSIRQQQDI